MELKPSIALLSLFSHAMYGVSNVRIGGAERRAFYWLKMLRQQGFPVAAVVAHSKSGSNYFASPINAPWPLFEHPKYHVNGTVVRAPKPWTGIPGKVRDVYFRLQKKPLPSSTEKNKWLDWAIYQHINAQIYVAFGLTNAANDLARFCTENHKRCVISIANDDDFDFLVSDFGKDEYDNKRYLKQSTLNLASLVVAQNSFQLKQLEKAGVADSRRVLILNPIDIHPLSISHRRTFAMWVGRADSNKNPMALVRLAERLPKIEFLVVLGSKTDEVSFSRLTHLPANINIIFAVSPQDMRKLYLDSFCLISTSFKEGFPNTFLEAWETGIPVASLHADPNFTLSQQNLGFHAKGNIEALADKIKEWSEMPEASARIGMRGRDYVEKNHHAELIQAQLINMFQSFG